MLKEDALIFAYKTYKWPSNPDVSVEEWVKNKITDHDANKDQGLDFIEFVKFLESVWIDAEIERE